MIIHVLFILAFVSAVCGVVEEAVDSYPVRMGVIEVMKELHGKVDASVLDEINVIVQDWRYNRALHGQTIDTDMQYNQIIRTRVGAERWDRAVQDAQATYFTKCLQHAALRSDYSPAEISWYLHYGGSAWRRNWDPARVPKAIKEITGLAPRDLGMREFPCNLPCRLACRNFLLQHLYAVSDAQILKIDAQLVAGSNALDFAARFGKKLMFAQLVKHLLKECELSELFKSNYAFGWMNLRWTSKELSRFGPATLLRFNLPEEIIRTILFYLLIQCLEEVYIIQDACEESADPRALWTFVYPHVVSLVRRMTIELEKHFDTRKDFY